MANAIQFQAGGTVYNIKDIEARTDINAITESTINLFVPTDAGFGQNLLCSGSADSVDVGQADLTVFVLR